MARKPETIDSWLSYLLGIALEGRTDRVNQAWVEWQFEEFEEFLKSYLHKKDK